MAPAIAEEGPRVPLTLIADGGPGGRGQDGHDGIGGEPGTDGLAGEDQMGTSSNGIPIE